MNPKPARPVTRGRRQFPRIKVLLSVLLKPAAGDPLKASTYNLSPGGAQIRCSRELAARLCPGGRFSPGGKGPTLAARFMVPLHAGPVPVEVMCRLVHLNPLSRPKPGAEVALGLKFLRFAGQGHLRHFMRFVEEQLVPAEDFEVYVRGRSDGPAPPAKRAGCGR